MTMEHKPKDSTPKSSTDSNKPESNQETKSPVGQWVTWEEFQGISGHGQDIFISIHADQRSKPNESTDANEYVE
jgi:hypothetical protein